MESSLVDLTGRGLITEHPAVPFLIPCTLLRDDGRQIRVSQAADHPDYFAIECFDEGAEKRFYVDGATRGLPCSNYSLSERGYAALDRVRNPEPATGKLGGRRRLSPKPNRTRRRPATTLTAKQETVVEMRERYKQTFSAIARLLECSPQAANQLYERAKANPGYKCQSVGKRKTGPLHSNTQGRTDRSGN
jgi:hypothetical protein